MRIKRDKFIEQYTTWLKSHLVEILPEEATEFRMVELARRQHHHDVNHLLAVMKGANYDGDGKGSDASSV